MLKLKTTNEPFIVKSSTTMLLATFTAGVFFAALLFFYPGHKFLGANFWPLVALPGALAIGCGYKLITNTPIFKIDAAGISFFRSGINLTWQQIQLAKIEVRFAGTDEEQNVFTVHYLAQPNTNLLAIEFVLTDAMNKTVADVDTALKYFADKA